MYVSISSTCSCPIYFRSYFANCDVVSGKAGMRSRSFTSSVSRVNERSVDCGFCTTLLMTWPLLASVTSVTIEYWRICLPSRSNSSIRIDLRYPYVARTAKYWSSFCENLRIISSGGSEGGAGGSGSVLSRRTSCSGGGESGACGDSCARLSAVLSANAAPKIIAIRRRCRRPSAISILIIRLDARTTPKAALLRERDTSLSHLKHCAHTSSDGSARQTPHRKPLTADELTASGGSSQGGEETLSGENCLDRVNQVAARA